VSLSVGHPPRDLLLNYVDPVMLHRLLMHLSSFVFLNTSNNLGLFGVDYRNGRIILVNEELVASFMSLITLFVIHSLGPFSTCGKWRRLYFLFLLLLGCTSYSSGPSNSSVPVWTKDKLDEKGQAAARDTRVHVTL